jgi:hypothetical protein
MARTFSFPIGSGDPEESEGKATACRKLARAKTPKTLPPSVSTPSRPSKSTIDPLNAMAGLEAVRVVARSQGA